MQGWLTKWDIKRNAFVLKYVPIRATKGYALANLLAQHPWVEVQDPLVDLNLFITVKSGVLMFHGYRTQKGNANGWLLD